LPSTPSPSTAPRTTPTSPPHASRWSAPASFTRFPRFFAIANNDFPKGPQDEDESDTPPHCEGCGCFLESDLTDEGAYGLLQTLERVLRGEQKCGEMLAQWVEHYEGRDDRITLGALVESGLTIGEILSAMRSKDAEIYRLTSAWKAA